MNTATVYYAEISESGERDITETTRGNSLHLVGPRPLAWGYFSTFRAASRAPLPAYDEARYQRFIRETDDFDAIERVRSQLALNVEAR